MLSPFHLTCLNQPFSSTKILQLTLSYQPPKQPSNQTHVSVTLNNAHRSALPLPGHHQSPAHHSHSFLSTQATTTVSTATPWLPALPDPNSYTKQATASPTKLYASQPLISRAPSPPQSNQAISTHNAHRSITAVPGTQFNSSTNTTKYPHPKPTNNPAQKMLFNHLNSTPPRHPNPYPLTSIFQHSQTRCKIVARHSQNGSYTSTQSSSFFQWTFPTHFRDSVRANQYGYVKTPSFLQCAGSNGDKNEDFEVQLVTNTALTNTLNSESIYALSGKFIALNNGSTPVLSYIQETVIRMGTPGPNQPDFTNKTVVTSLGMVVSRQEVATQASDSATQLEVIISHCDWDGEDRVHRRFNIKYIVPGTKNLVKTHTLYQVGREVYIIGRLVDFHMDENIAVVVVFSTKVLKFLPKAGPSPSTSTAAGLPKPKLTKSPATPTASVKNGSPPKQSLDKDNKGKARAVDESESDDDDGSNDNSDEESEVDTEATPNIKAKRGRPRKTIIQEALKRMKKH
ncbi:hypothetical protein PGTUg99_035512 [Puccinia graminis f. sp. tritici]|uniref:Uncharacterized protein n=1 Tax=Puccinia graminis f. sp. tritici TaxID=56615 RepID=A0A5B0RIQ2_PUCGR|nr:hypothetical protein PGTUg99_035512 [Puccinia graminis f. sp. tritici]